MQKRYPPYLTVEKKSIAGKNHVLRNARAPDADPAARAAARVPVGPVRQQPARRAAAV